MNVIDFVRVGMKITRYRKKLNLTQDDIARMLYVSRQLVSKWENGTGVPSVDVLLEFCKIFHTTFEDLLCLNDEISTDPNDIFVGHDRMYVIRNIISGDIVVNIPDIFYQFSPTERMMVLRAVKDGKIDCNMYDLFPKLTPGEQVFLRKDDNI